MPQRYKVITERTLGQPLFHVADVEANDAIVSTHNTRPAADAAIRRYNADDWDRERAAVRLGIPEFPRPR